MKTYDFYKKLLPLESGQAPKDEKEEEETKEMKMWLMQNFGTTKVSEIDKEKLK